jgi:hypothetical protein
MDMATYGHGRNHPGESQRDRATPPWNICPTTLPVVAGSHRHVHLIDAGIHVLDETVHAPAGLCADKDCETIPLLKWRLDRYVLKTGRVSVAPGLVRLALPPEYLRAHKFPPT